jgi:succinate dehydrogenase/fumarate reductase cytochrome b subunit
VVAQGQGKREWHRLTTWKGSSAGSWAWLLQRLAALFLIPLILLHIAYPYKLLTQFLLLMTIVFHGMLGIRVLLIDMGVGIQNQKIILGIVASLGLVLIVIVWWQFI